MSKRPPIIRIRCEVSEDECCSSSGGEEISNISPMSGWSLYKKDKMTVESTSTDKRHSSPDIRLSSVGSTSSMSSSLSSSHHNSRGLLLSPSSHQETFQPPPTPISPLAKHPLTSHRNPWEKRLSAPSCLAPPSPLACFFGGGSNSMSSTYGIGHRHSLEDGGPMDHNYFWLYRRLARSQKRRFSDTTRLEKSRK